MKTFILAFIFFPNSSNRSNVFKLILLNVPHIFGYFWSCSVFMLDHFNMGSRNFVGESKEHRIFRVHVLLTYFAGPGDGFISH